MDESINDRRQWIHWLQRCVEPLDERQGEDLSPARVFLECQEEKSLCCYLEMPATLGHHPSVLSRKQDMFPRPLAVVSLFVEVLGSSGTGRPQD
jgi:hypothetical protein